MQMNWILGFLEVPYTETQCLISVFANFMIDKYYLYGRF